MRRKFLNPMVSFYKTNKLKSWDVIWLDHLVLGVAPIRQKSECLMFACWHSKSNHLTKYVYRKIYMDKFIIFWYGNKKNVGINGKGIIFLVLSFPKSIYLYKSNDHVVIVSFLKEQVLYQYIWVSGRKFKALGWERRGRIQQGSWM